MTIKTYEFDGTLEGYQLMMQRLYPNKHHGIYGWYDVRQNIAHVYDTRTAYKKGDFYQVQLKENVN
jgi:hypothetical protein